MWPRVAFLKYKSTIVRITGLQNKPRGIVRRFTQRFLILFTL